MNMDSSNNGLWHRVVLLNVIALWVCEALAVHERSSLLVPKSKHSKGLGLVAGIGTTFVTVADLLKMFRRQSGKSMIVMLAGIIGVSQIVWFYYGLLIA
jgi:hypothetical protein